MPISESKIELVNPYNKLEDKLWWPILVLNEPLSTSTTILSINILGHLFIVKVAGVLVNSAT